VQEIHDAITGSTKRPGEPGVLETQRRQGDRLDGHDERLTEHDVAIQKLEARVEGLECAPAKAATQELENRKADEKALKQTAIAKFIELGLAAGFGGIAAAGALLAALWSGLLKFVGHTVTP
jgi:hypothetical protein